MPSQVRTIPQDWKAGNIFLIDLLCFVFSERYDRCPPLTDPATQLQVFDYFDSRYLVFQKIKGLHIDDHCRDWHPTAYVATILNAEEAAALVNISKSK